MKYTQSQLARILGVGKWWNMFQASRRLGNISQANLRELIASFPRGINGVIVSDSELFKGNEEFMFIGTAGQKKRRLQVSRLYLVMSLRQSKTQLFPSIVRGIRADISALDKQLEALKGESSNGNT